jgi:hypothetical protein
MDDDNNKSLTSHVSNGYLCLHPLSVLISHHMYVLGYYLFFSFLSFVWFFLFERVLTFIVYLVNI